MGFTVFEVGSSFLLVITKFCLALSKSLGSMPKIHKSFTIILHRHLWSYVLHDGYNFSNIIYRIWPFKVWYKTSIFAFLWVDIYNMITGLCILLYSSNKINLTVSSNPKCTSTWLSLILKWFIPFNLSVLV